MEIIPQQDVDAAHIAAQLRQGKTLVYPTETCYGLGCDATNAIAVKQIFAIKERAEGKSLLVVVDALETMLPFIFQSTLLKKIATTYWPGPLTVIVPAREKTLAPGVVSSDGAVAFRVSSHSFVRSLCEAMKTPIVSTSANIAGGSNPYTIEEVTKAFHGRPHMPDMCVDGGQLPLRAPSTIIRIHEDEYTVIRQGDIVVRV